ncbi:hypothetical protein [Mogibacterium diversum]|uniref:hypothetical protein n=1 Tax=Mogibacterium diversum TaxID=114527 RepID=UPI001CB00425|nr:hypothetical protein [Mogibacterium diversum]MBF1331229.1 hypothetical protein [Mogibacterium diversum]
MSKKGKINYNDPDYTNYLDEYNKLSREYLAKENEIFSQLTEDTRREVSKSLGRLRRCFAHELKALQNKYAHIFNVIDTKNCHKERR